MNNLEKYNLPGKTREKEEQKLKEKAESGESQNYDSLEQVVEKEKQEEEFSPEIIETIMEKVEDINKKGTAYSVMREYVRDPEERLKSILEAGLLGCSLEETYGGDKKITKEKWYHNVRRKKKEGFIYFNIRGREQEQGLRKSLTQSRWIGKKKSPLVFLFDISSLKEGIPDSIKIAILEDKFESWNIKDKTHTFRADDPNLARLWQKYFPNLKPGDPKILESPYFKEDRDFAFIDERGFPMPDTEYGFVASFRIAPRLFRGICYNRDEYGNAIINPDEVVSSMNEVWESRKELLIPVYDTYGNLYWPQKIGYEDVKKFVEERDKDKNQKE